jgi:hypothetical protein
VVNGDCSNLIGQEVTAIIDATNTRFGKVENAVFDGSNTTVTIDTYWLEQCFDPTHSNESFFIADARNTWVDVPQDNEDLDNILFFPDSSQSGTKTIGDNAIVLGNGNEATMTHSIAIGRDNKAEGKYAVAIGRENRAGYAAYAEGRANKAYGTYSHAEGNLNESTGWYSHTEGVENKAIGGASHAEGKGTIAEGHQSHTEGLNTKVQAVEGYAFHNGEGSHAEGSNTIAASNYCHAEGLNTKAYGSVSHAEGVNTQALGSHSHAEGLSTIAKGDYSHAEGFGNATASGKGSHAEGENTTASGATSHAEGSGTKATKHAAHAEGNGTQAIGDQSHAEGLFTIASGLRAHAEGWSTQAKSTGAHSAGIATIAGHLGQTVVGIANNNKSDNLFEVGNGEYTVQSDKAVVTKYSNAFEVKKDGTVYSQEGKLATENFVNSKVGKPDWNESDVTSLNFIKNRTHYGASEPIAEELVAEHHNPASYYLSEHVNNTVMVHRYGSGINEWYELTIETKDLTDKDGNLIENTACINLDNKFIIWGHERYISYEEYLAMDGYEQQAYFEELGWDEYIKWHNIAESKYKNGDRNSPIICLCVNEYDGNICSYDIYDDFPSAEKVLDPRYIPTDFILADVRKDIETLKAQPEIVTSATQPTPVEGKIIIWIDTSALS